MHIAIDDTYGPEGETGSKFVTGARRTHVAVMFPDSEANYIREQIMGCLEEVETLTGVRASEFHFADIYHKRHPWKVLPDQQNLMLFEVFAEIYRSYRWRVYIQTIDDRTLQDHGIQKILGTVADLDLSKRDDVSLLFLLLKIKLEHKSSPFPINLFLDEGRRKPGADFGGPIFHDWSEQFLGKYCSSGLEPLLQIADFLAFSINRSTYLATKKNRTEIDNWFVSLVGSMQINSLDLKRAVLPEGFGIEDFDALHREDREEKGL